MLYWVAATFKPKTKKDEEALPDDIIIQPQVVVAKDEQSAAMKVTVKESEVLKKYDQDRVNIFVRPF
jgi:hypothetical protein